jgi:hypothetical protein
MRLIKVHSRWCAIAGLLRWGSFAANANVGEGLWPNDVRRTSSSRNKTSLNKCHLKTHQWPKRQREKSLAARYTQRRCLRKRKRPCASRSTVAQQREWIRQRATIPAEPKRKFARSSLSIGRERCLLACSSLPIGREQCSLARSSLSLLECANQKLKMQQRANHNARITELPTTATGDT